MKQSLLADDPAHNAKMSDMKSVIRSQFEEKYINEESTIRSSFFENKKTDFKFSTIIDKIKHENNLKSKQMNNLNQMLNNRRLKESTQQEKQIKSMKYIDTSKFLESTNFVTYDYLNEEESEKYIDKVTYYLPFKNQKNMSFLGNHLQFLEDDKERFMRVWGFEKEQSVILTNMLKQRKDDIQVISTKIADLKY